MTTELPAGPMPAFNVADFDAFLAENASRPPMLVVSLTAMAHILGLPRYAQWYNARHPNRKISWRRLTRPQHEAAVEMYVRNVKSGLWRD